MKNLKNKKIVFFGTNYFAAQILTGLLDNGLLIPTIVTQPDRPVGRKQTINPTPVKLAALKAKLKIIQPENIKNTDFQKIFSNLHPDLVILAAYGQIIPPQILSIPRYGFINIHPSLLPKYRGACPTVCAIKNQDQQSGISIMLMDDKMDHGPILAQKKINILPDDTNQTLLIRCAEQTPKFLITTIQDYLTDKIIPQKQNHKQASFCRQLQRKDGHINWNGTAQIIEHQIRAYSSWPQSFSFYSHKNKKHTLKILKAEASTVPVKHNMGTLIKINSKPAVATKDFYLLLRQVQPENKKPIPAIDFINGYGYLIEKILF